MEGEKFTVGKHSTGKTKVEDNSTDILFSLTEQPKTYKLKIPISFFPLKKIQSNSKHTVHQKMKLSPLVKILLAIAVIAGVAYVIKSYYYPSDGMKKYQAVTEGDIIKKCKGKCDTINNACMKACNIGGKYKDACLTVCKVAKFGCNATCTGKFGLRNGSLHHINIWNKDKVWLDRLTPWSPKNVSLSIDQFPIYASRCPELDEVCPKEDTKFTLKIEDPGCYIIWGGGIGDLYTTKGICV